MEELFIINTGGTFNKVYNPISGELEVDKTSAALKQIAKKWQCELKIADIIGKDSLKITNHDRLELSATIHQSHIQKIIIVHGTDTLHLTAAYLADSDLGKKIVLTGAMTPFSIDPVEATANFTSAYGFLQSLQKNGVYIAMHGLIASYENIIKDQKAGKFIFN